MTVTAVLQFGHHQVVNVEVNGLDLLVVRRSVPVYHVGDEVPNGDLGEVVTKIVNGPGMWALAIEVVEAEEGAA